MNGRQLYIRSLWLVMLTVLCGCARIHEDLEPCGLYVRFKYDYNMLYADAFPRQVDPVEVFLFDDKGVFLKSFVESGSALQNEGYRMKMEIGPGDYTAVAWAGRHDSYALEPMEPRVSTLDDLRLKLKYDTTRVWSTEMENLWHATPVKFSFDPSQEKEVTLSLVRNTNRVRLVMKDVNATETEAVSADHFSVRLTAANAYYDYQHNWITDSTITYTPYYQAGDSYDGVVAELNTMRLMSDKDCRLSVTDIRTGQSVLGEKTPAADLIKYLLLTKMEYPKMGDQEYLDREYDWKVIIYYQKQAQANDQYLALKLVVNDWTVWRQDADLVNPTPSWDL